MKFLPNLLRNSIQRNVYREKKQSSSEGDRALLCDSAQCTYFVEIVEKINFYLKFLEHTPYDQVQKKKPMWLKALVWYTHDRDREKVK